MNLKSRKVVICLAMGMVALVIILVAAKLNTGATSKTTDVVSLNFGEVDQDIINQIDAYVFDNSVTDVASIMGLDLKAISATQGETVAAAAASAVQQQSESTTAAETVAETTAAPQSAYANKFMVNVSEYLNVRETPTQDGTVVGKLYAGSGGDVLEKGDTWTKISSGNVVGYVSNEFVKFGDEAEALAQQTGKLVVTVKTDTLRIRKEPNTDSGIWDLAAAGSTLSGIAVEGDWVSVNYEGITAYVNKEYVTTELVIGTAVSIEEEQAALKAAEEQKAKEAEEAAQKAAAAQAAQKAAVAASKFVETVQTSSYNVSEDDAYLLACLVSSEAGYEPYEGKLAVANIVLNRLNGGSYGNSIHDVIYASGQFTVASSGVLAKKLASGPNEESIAATKEALSGVNNVSGYTNFISSKSADFSAYSQYTIIGNHCFYKR